MQRLQPATQVNSPCKKEKEMICISQPAQQLIPNKDALRLRNQVN